MADYITTYACFKTSETPSLTRNPGTFTTSNCPYHRHFWIPAFGDLCVTFRDSRESENPECPQIRRTPSPPDQVRGRLKPSPGGRGDYSKVSLRGNDGLRGGDML